MLLLNEAMDEVFKFQETITDSLQLENEKYEQLEEVHNLDQMISRVKEYHEKVVNIKKSMLLIKERTGRLKKKATKMLEDKNKEDLELQRSRERQEMLERHLEPVVNTRGD